MSDKSSYSENLILISLAVGTFISAAVLYQHATHPIAENLIGFGVWIASWFNIRGFWPALGITSLLAGVLLMLAVMAVAPKLEEWAAKKAADRGKRTLAEVEGLSVEDEMKLLVEKFGNTPKAGGMFASLFGKT